MMIKVDLEKAYDRLKWDFIYTTMKYIVLPENITNMVRHCISSSRMRVLWNGEMLNSFTQFQGVRQCDPISP